MLCLFWFVFGLGCVCVGLLVDFDCFHAEFDCVICVVVYCVWCDVVFVCGCFVGPFGVACMLCCGVLVCVGLCCCVVVLCVVA